MKINRDNLTLWGKKYNGGTVPTACNLPKTMRLYSNYIGKKPKEPNRKEFCEYLMSHWGSDIGENNAYAQSEAISYFKLFDESPEIITGLTAACKKTRKKNIQTFLNKFKSTDKICIPLVDVYIIGTLGVDKPVSILNKSFTDGGFAGTDNSAFAIRSVGKNTGDFFGFFEINDATGNYRCTEYFNEYFNCRQ